MFTEAIDLALNVIHALQISPPNYARPILGDPDSWRTKTCPPTELQLAEMREWSKGLPALAHVLIPGVPWKPPVGIPFSDMLFRPSVAFRYPQVPDVVSPTPKQRWFFINGICTDHSVVLLNAAYLHALFGRPLTVIHNFTRGTGPELVACAVGKEWEQVTESSAVAFPHIYAALKNPTYERVILLGHSQGTILSAVVLALLEELYSPIQTQLAALVVVRPERAVARKLWRASVCCERKGTRQRQHCRRPIPARRRMGASAQRALSLSDDAVPQSRRPGRRAAADERRPVDTAPVRLFEREVATAAPLAQIRAGSSPTQPKEGWVSHPAGRVSATDVQCGRRAA